MVCQTSMILSCASDQQGQEQSENNSNLNSYDTNDNYIGEYENQGNVNSTSNTEENTNLGYENINNADGNYGIQGTENTNEETSNYEKGDYVQGDSEQGNYGQGNMENNYDDNIATNEVNAEANNQELATDNYINANNSELNSDIVNSYEQDNKVAEGAELANQNNAVVPESQLTSLNQEVSNTAMPVQDLTKTVQPTSIDQVQVQKVPIPYVDLYPKSAILKWIGYDYRVKDRKLVIDIVTEGKPLFEIFQEKNISAQPELVIRFLETKLRKKVSRDIDASEFLSPVAYVRSREDKANSHTDVVLTFREAVHPKVFAKEGNIRLTISIPYHYFIKEPEKRKEAIAKAENLENIEIRPSYEDNSDSPKSSNKRYAYIPDPSQGSFEGAPEGGGQSVSRLYKEDEESRIDAEGMPPSFEESNQGEEKDKVESKNEGYNAAKAVDRELSLSSLEDLYSIYTFSVGAVAQDTVEEGGYNNFTNNGAAEGAFNVVEDNGYSEQGAGYQNASDNPVEVNEVSGADYEGDTKNFQGRPIVIDFHQAPLDLVLQTFSEESGNNFVYPKEIGETSISIRLKQVPWDEALQAILETYGLAMIQVGQNVMRIDKLRNMTKFLKEMEDAKLYKRRMIPTKVLVMRLSNARVDKISTSIKELLAQEVVDDPRVKVSTDVRTNSIIVEGPEHVLGKVKTIIERMDIETPQVEIASRIVEVARNVNNFLGILWDSAFNFDPGRGLGFGALAFPNSFTSTFAVDPGVRAETTSGNLNLRFGSLNDFLNLDLLLKMEERRGTTNILQSNKVLVLDRQNAVITAGSSQFFRPPAGAADNIIGGAAAGAAGGGGGEAEGLSEITFNLSLNVTPEITASGLVNMKIKISSDSPGDPTGEALAQKSTREVETTLSRKSGDTAVIGGIYDTTSQKTVVGIPYLSRIPILGALFRSTRVKESQMELLVMVTPTIMGSGEPAKSEVQVLGATTMNGNSQGENVENSDLNNYGVESGGENSGEIAQNTGYEAQQETSGDEESLEEDSQYEYSQGENVIQGEQEEGDEGEEAYEQYQGY